MKGRVHNARRPFYFRSEIERGHGGIAQTILLASLVRRMAADLVRAHPAFPVERFVKRATTGLAALELLDRGRHIARALAECLPNVYPDAVRVLLRSLGPKHAGDELVGAGMEPFF